MFSFFYWKLSLNHKISHKPLLECILIEFEAEKNDDFFQAISKKEKHKII